MSDLIWEAVLYTNIPCPYSLLRSGQALDEGPLLKKEYLDPNFFAQLNQKILPCFNFDFTKFHLKRRDTVYCFQSQYGSK